MAPFVQTNCYLVAGPDDTCVVVDPGGGATAEIADTAKKAGWRIAGVVLTHGHVDHVWSAGAIANSLDVPVWIHAEDAAELNDPMSNNGVLGGFLDVLLMQCGESPRGYEFPRDIRTVETPKNGSVEVDLAGIPTSWIHAPGHTPGSGVLQFDSGVAPGSSLPPVLGGVKQSNCTILTGDVIFAGSIGRCDLPGGDERVMMATLRRLSLDLPRDAVLLTGHGPATTMAYELKVNPFLRG
mgnify:CR=1 FL=1